MIFFTGTSFRFKIVLEAFDSDSSQGWEVAFGHLRQCELRCAYRLSRRYKAMPAAIIARHRI